MGRSRAWPRTVRTLVTLLDPADPEGMHATVSSPRFGGLARILSQNRSALSMTYGCLGVALTACLPGAVLVGRWTSTKSKHDPDIWYALAFSSLPLALFILREWLGRRPRRMPGFVRSIGRWLVVLCFGAAASSLIWAVAAGCFDESTTGSVMSSYDWDGEKLISRFWWVSSYNFLATAAVFIVVALVWRGLVSWRQVQLRMSALVVVSAVGALTVLTPLSLASDESTRTVVGYVAVFAIVGFLAGGPLIRALPRPGGVTSLLPGSPVSSAKYLASAHVQSQLAIFVVLIAIDLVLSYHVATATVFRVRDIFAVGEAAQAISEALPQGDADFDKIVEKPMWDEHWIPRGWSYATGSQLDWPNGSQMGRRLGALFRSGMSPEWRILRTREHVPGDQWVRVSAMWLTGTNDELFGPVSRVTTIYGLKVDVGGSGEPKRPRWSHVVLRSIEHRGSVGDVRRIVSRGQDKTLPTSFVTKANSPEYDFGRWSRAHTGDDVKEALYGVALSEGIDVEQNSDTGGIIVKIERVLINRSISLPTVGLNLPPLRAIVALALAFFYLIVSVRNGVRHALRDPTRAEGEPWLILDAETKSERSTAVAWAGAICVAPFVIGAGFLHMSFRRAVLDGDVSIPGLLLTIGLTAIFVAGSAYVALTLISSLATLRELRRAASGPVVDAEPSASSGHLGNVAQPS